MPFKVEVDSTRWLPKDGMGALKMRHNEPLEHSDYETAIVGEVIDPDPVQVPWLVRNGFVTPQDEEAAEMVRQILAYQPEVQPLAEPVALVEAPTEPKSDE